MRANTKDAMHRWGQDRASQPGKQGTAIWTDGTVLWSYRTAMGIQSEKHGLILNRTRYSVTTTIQQGGIAQSVGHYLAVDDLPMGCTGDDLERAAYSMSRRHPREYLAARRIDAESETGKAILSRAVVAILEATA